MGEVIRFPSSLRECKCGWKTPRKVDYKAKLDQSILADWVSQSVPASAIEVTLEFTCPECGNEFVTTWTLHG